MAYLLIQTGPGKGQRVDLTADAVTIGSSKQADIRVRQKGVAKIHATITRRSDGSYFIGQGKGVQGLLVDRKRVKMTDLADGAFISIGNLRIQFFLGLGDGRNNDDKKHDHLVLDMFREQQVRFDTEAGGKKYNITSLQIKIAVGSMVAVVAVLVFFWALSRYKPDETKAIESMAPMAQKIIESGAIKLKPSGKEKQKKSKITGYYEDDEETNLNISGGPKPKGHINFDGGKLSKKQKEAVDKKKKEQAEKAGSTTSSNQPSGFKPSKLNNQSGGKTLETGDINAPSGSGGAKSGSSAKGGKGQGALSMGSTQGQSKIKTGNVSGGSDGPVPDIPDQSGSSGDGNMPIPEGAEDGESPQIETGGVKGGKEATDKTVDEMLDDKQKQIEEADNSNLAKYKGKKLDREAVKNYDPFGQNGKTPKKEEEISEEEKKSEPERGRFYFELDTYEICSKGSPVAVPDDAGGYILVWIEKGQIHGDRYDLSGVDADCSFWIDETEISAIGPTEIDQDHTGRFYVTWNPNFE